MSDSNLLTKVTGTASVRRVEIKLELNSSIQDVWEAITDNEKVKHWWTDGIIEAREGGKFVLEDGSEVNGTVKLCHPPYLFEFSWNDAPAKAGHPHLIDAKTNSTVRFDLVETGAERTLLNFVQYLPPGEIVGAAAGWHQIIGDRLKEFVEHGSVTEDKDRLNSLLEEYAAAGMK